MIMSLFLDLWVHYYKSYKQYNITQTEDTCIFDIIGLSLLDMIYGLTYCFI